VYLLLSILTPLIASPLVYWCYSKRGSIAVAVTTLSYLIAILLVSLSLISGFRVETYYEKIGEIFGLSLFIDEFSYMLCLATTVLFVSSTIFSVEYMKGRLNSYGTYYVLLLILYSSLIGVLTSYNLLLWLIFYEFSMIPAVLIIAKWGYRDTIRIAVLTLIFSLVGGFLLMASFALVYYETSTLFMPAVAERILYVEPLAKVVIALTLTGLFIKLPVFPLHYWLPLAHAEAPAPLSAILSGIIIETAAYGVIRVVYQTLIEPLAVLRGSVVYEALSPLIAACIAIALISIFYSSIMALREPDIKRIVAFSSITHMNFVLLAFSIGVLRILRGAPSLAITASAYHLIAHSVSKGLWFLFTGTLMHMLHERNIYYLRGVLQSSKTLQLLGTATLLAMVSVPPFACFFGELYMLLASYAPIGFYGIIVSMLFACGIAFSSGYVVRFLYLTWSPEEHVEHSHSTTSYMKLPKLMTISMLILLASIIAIGLLSFQLLDLLRGCLRGA